jgi:predicted type IV restriction endonuclease
MQQPAKELRDVIAQMKQRILSFAGKKISEEDTKFKLINPILAVLGWDMQQHDEVRLEFRSESHHNPVDYAFFHNGKPILFLEAKALGGDIDDPKFVNQTMKYAYEADVEWCVLSNGNVYCIYRTYEKGKSQDRLFRKINLTEDTDLEEIAYFLGLLTRHNVIQGKLSTQWKESFADQKVKAAIEKLVTDQDDALVRMLLKKTEGLQTAEIRQSLSRARVSIGFHLDGLTLGKPQARAKKATKQRAKAVAQVNISLQQLIESGIVKPPQRILSHYKGQTLEARILRDGDVEYNGHKYSSLSVAGGVARVVVSGPPASGAAYYPTNGWTFWQYQDASGGLHPLDHWRELYIVQVRKSLQVV